MLSCAKLRAPSYDTVAPRTQVSFAEETGLLKYDFCRQLKSPLLIKPRIIL